MALRDWKGRGAAHAPVHPVTGAPVAPASSAGSAVGGGSDEQSEDAAPGSASASAVGKGAQPRPARPSRATPRTAKAPPTSNRPRRFGMPMSLPALPPARLPLAPPVPRP